MVVRLTVVAWALARAALAQDGQKLEQRGDGLWYMPGQSVPYSGRAGERAFNGVELSEAYYRKGIQHGAARFWYSNGKVRSTFTYLNGELDGNATYYYRNGQRQSLTTYRAGVKHGPVIDWWPEGGKSFEEHYRNGVPEGGWRSWWPNGKLASEKVYRNRALTAHREWSRDGTPRQLPGWNLDGTRINAATANVRNQMLGRRMLWNRGSGANRIDVIYRDKPITTLRRVFGDPDQSDDTAWTYRGLRIQDPASGGRYTTAIFRLKKGRVSEILIE